MSTMKALVMDGPKSASVQEIQQPKLRPDYVKTKVLAVALNPTDWKHIGGASEEGAIIGCDFSGVVTEIGADVKGNYKKGDKIYGMVSGANVSNHEDGCFAEYAVVRDGCAVKIPSNLSEEAAATLALGLLTCGQGMYQSLELPWPNSPAKEAFPLLIYGGSTATGMLAIQLAKLSGLQVITTASKHNHDALKKFGADEVFDYSDKDCAAKIREYTKDKLYFAFDTISEKNSPQICADALSSKAPSTGLHYSSLLPVQNFPRKDVKDRSTLAYTAIGEAFTKFGQDFPAMPDNYEFGKKFLSVAGDLIEAGKIKPANYTVKDGGLNGILSGLDEMKEGKVSGTKLVYKVSSA